jgi:hypothetical protein
MQSDFISSCPPLPSTFTYPAPPQFAFNIGTRPPLPLRLPSVVRIVPGPPCKPRKMKSHGGLPPSPRTGSPVTGCIRSKKKHPQRIVQNYYAIGEYGTLGTHRFLGMNIVPLTPAHPKENCFYCSRTNLLQIKNPQGVRPTNYPTGGYETSGFCWFFGMSVASSTLPPKDWLHSHWSHPIEIRHLQGLRVTNYAIGAYETSGSIGSLG